MGGGDVGWRGGRWRCRVVGVGVWEVEMGEEVRWMWRGSIMAQALIWYSCLPARSYACQTQCMLMQIWVGDTASDMCLHQCLFHQLTPRDLDDPRYQEGNVSFYCINTTPL